MIDISIPSWRGGLGEILLLASCYGNWDKLWINDGPVGSNTDLLCNLTTGTLSRVIKDVRYSPEISSKQQIQ